MTKHRRLACIMFACLAVPAWMGLAFRTASGKQAGRPGVSHPDPVAIEHNLPIEAGVLVRERLIPVDFDAVVDTVIPGRYFWRVEVYAAEGGRHLGGHDFEPFDVEASVPKADRIVWGMAAGRGTYRVVIRLLQVAPVVDMDGNQIADVMRAGFSGYRVVVRGD